MIAVAVGEIRDGTGIFPDVAFRHDFCVHSDRFYAAGASGLS
jgi:hypothetical protein